VSLAFEEQTIPTKQIQNTDNVEKSVEQIVLEPKNTDLCLSGALLQYLFESSAIYDGQQQLSSTGNIENKTRNIVSPSIVTTTSLILIKDGH
jgi:hypothetical protein